MQHYLRSRKAGGGNAILPLRSGDSYSKTQKSSKARSLGRTLILFGCWISLSILVLMALWLSGPIRKAYNTATTPDHPSEMQFVTEDGTMEDFPSLFDDASVTLSVVVPAYNEEERMPPAIADMLAVLKDIQRQEDGFVWEIIIVDDGSKDNTANIATELTQKESASRVRLLKLHQNSGKGAAVRKGMLRARGKYVLMADADGATAATEVVNVMDQLKSIETDGLGIAIGSRAHLGDGSGSVQRSALRRFLMWGFHTFISILVGGGGGIKDTQCGFKMFTRQAAREIFSVLHIERWAFDVEIIFLAARKQIPMVEVPVQWQEMSGSKVDIIPATIQMARDIIVIRLCYSLGLWSDAPVSATTASAATGLEPIPVDLIDPAPAGAIDGA